MYEPNYTTYPTGAEDSTAAMMLGLSIVLFTLLFAVAMYVIVALCLSKIFKKAGVEGWIAWVPFYNTWKLLEIGGQPGFWAILAIIPVVSIVAAIFTYIAMYEVGLKLGKEGVFVLWAIFFPLVWFVWLAFDDKAVWQAAAAPTSAPVTPPPTV